MRQALFAPCHRTIIVQIEKPKITFRGNETVTVEMEELNKLEHGLR